LLVGGVDVGGEDGVPVLRPAVEDAASQGRGRE
jgi:hypothetical protein